MSEPQFEYATNVYEQFVGAAVDITDDVVRRGMHYEYVRQWQYLPDDFRDAVCALTEEAYPDADEQDSIDHRSLLIVEYGVVLGYAATSNLLIQDEDAQSLIGGLVRDLDAITEKVIDDPMVQERRYTLEKEMRIRGNNMFRRLSHSLGEQAFDFFQTEPESELFGFCFGAVANAVQTELLVQTMRAQGDLTPAQQEAMERAANDIHNTPLPWLSVEAIAVWPEDTIG